MHQKPSPSPYRLNESRKLERASHHLLALRLIMLSYTTQLLNNISINVRVDDLNSNRLLIVSRPHPRRGLSDRFSNRSPSLWQWEEFTSRQGNTSIATSFSPQTLHRLQWLTRSRVSQRTESLRLWSRELSLRHLRLRSNPWTTQMVPRQQIISFLFNGLLIGLKDELVV